MIGCGLMARRLVVVDTNAEACEAARALGAAVMHGDASRNEVLEAAKIEQAAAMVVSAGRDDASVLIVLTARSLTRSLPIAVTIREADNEDLATHAGATHVVNPVHVTGRLLAETVAGCVKGPATVRVRA